MVTLRPQCPDSELEAYRTSPVHPLEEEGECLTGKHDSDQQISEEKTTGKPSEESDPLWVASRYQSLKAQPPHKMITLLPFPEDN